MSTSDENDHEHSDEAKASMAEALREYVPKAEQDETCDHHDLDGMWCLGCNRDVSDEVISRAEAAADAREDR